MATTLNITQIPSNRVPFIDERTGLMSREWYRWFINVFTQLGGGTSDVAAADLAVAPLAQDPFVIEQNVTQQAQLAVIMAQYDKLFDDLSPHPELGTMAPQNAASVSITGGAISGVTVSTTGGATLISTSAALTDGAAAAAGTLLNAPAAGDPTKWFAINDNGTTRYVPSW